MRSPAARLSVHPSPFAAEKYHSWTIEPSLDSAWWKKGELSAKLKSAAGPQRDLFHTVVMFPQLHVHNCDWYRCGIARVREERKLARGAADAKTLQEKTKIDVRPPPSAQAVKARTDARRDQHAHDFEILEAKATEGWW